MIKIETRNEVKDGYDLEVHIEGNGAVIVNQMVDILNKLYEVTPKLFETALVMSKYTVDHT